MAPSRRAERQEIYVPHGSLSVGAVLPQMRELGIPRLVYLRRENKLDKARALLLRIRAALQSYLSLSHISSL
jgi:hypothetical protein